MTYQAVSAVLFLTGTHKTTTLFEIAKTYCMTLSPSVFDQRLHDTISGLRAGQTLAITIFWSTSTYQYSTDLSLVCSLALKFVHGALSKNCPPQSNIAHVHTVFPVSVEHSV